MSDVDGDVAAATVVLVHGNFLGVWSWRDVEPPLNAAGVPTVAVDLPSAADGPEPPGDLHGDAAAVRATLDALTPPVVLCGHSYGGAVITEAAAGPHPAVRHLVYLAGAVPDAGESLASLAPAPAPSAGEQPDGGGEQVEARADGRIALRPDSAAAALFHDCAPYRLREAIGLLRPSNPVTGGQPVRGAAWRELPATYVRCRQDRMPELVSREFPMDRAEVVHLPTGHCPNWSAPGRVAELLRARAVAVADAGRRSP